MTIFSLSALPLRGAGHQRLLPAAGFEAVHDLHPNHFNQDHVTLGVLALLVAFVLAVIAYIVLLRPADPIHPLTDDRLTISLRPKMTLYVFMVGVLAGGISCVTGLFVLLVWLFEGGTILLPTGLLFYLAGPIVMGCLMRSGSLLLDSKGFVVRRFWRTDRFEWSQVRSIADTGFQLRLPMGIIVTLYGRSWLGLPKSLYILDALEMKRAVLAQTMEQLRMHAQRNSVPAAWNGPATRSST